MDAHDDHDFASLPTRSWLISRFSDSILERVDAMVSSMPDEGGRITAEFGRYRIPNPDEPLGDGGQALVYDALQRMPSDDAATDDILRPVAIKVINFSAPDSWGMGRSDARRRAMLREAQCLARLTHPNIATIHDVDILETQLDDWLYIAMERLVAQVDDSKPPEPTTIEKYVAKRPHEDRIRLLIQVCLAVHYAHENTIFHLDLKPSNVLMDAQGRPKVLDFGVAVLGDDGASTTSDLPVGGTYGYMSPEQTTCTRAEVGAWIDVYGLGMLLFTVLTGEMARPLSEFASVTLTPEVDERIRNLIQSQPLPAPSLHDASLRGDIDAIFRKATEFDPAKRYSSAEALARDLERHLARDAVDARKHEFFHAPARFAARHRTLVAGIAATILSLAGGLAGTTAMAHRAELHAAESERQSHIAELAAAESERQSHIAEQTLSFLVVDILSAATPGPNRDITVRQVVHQAAEGIPAIDDPVVRAEIHGTLGRVLHAIADYERSVVHLDYYLDDLGDDSYFTDSGRQAHQLRVDALYRSDQSDRALAEATAFRRVHNEDPTAALLLSNALKHFAKELDDSIFGHTLFIEIWSQFDLLLNIATWPAAWDDHRRTRFLASVQHNIGTLATDHWHWINGRLGEFDAMAQNQDAELRREFEELRKDLPLRAIDALAVAVNIRAEYRDESNEYMTGYLQTLSELGLAYVVGQDLSSARATLELAVDGWEMHDPIHQRALRTRENLGRVLYRLAERAEQESRHDEAVALLRESVQRLTGADRGKWLRDSERKLTDLTSGASR